MCRVRGRPRPMARGSLRLDFWGAGKARGCSTAGTLGTTGGLEDCLRVRKGDSDGGEVDKGPDRMREGFEGTRGDDDGVVNVVEVDRKELLLPNENQEPERVTVEADEEVADDVLETESIVDDRVTRAATAFLILCLRRTVSDNTSSRALPFSSTFSAGSRRTARSSTC